MGDPNERVERIFAASLEMADRVKRTTYLQQACVGDEALRREVESLLAAHERAGDFLETMAALFLIPLSGPGGTGWDSDPITDPPDERIGPYELLAKIGEGGCGAVYLAQQTEPVRRRVALKIIKLGMDSRQVVARFEAERQALALMDHPNIARVFDGGTTETGRPYFVMELVRGIRITHYCDENQLSIRDRLALFIQVCHAIQHAHQKGVVHRDIKPSNILVMLHDSVPLPKVIDFGIAKALEQRLTDKTVFTALDQFIGTPTYMSPEQAGRSGLDIDTRSDIYSLGVLLYELLTGRTPFESKELQAGLDEMRRTIRDKEPPRPSTRLRRLPHAELSFAAQHRQTQAPKLIHLLRGDLEWIVMKCLEKDRSRRYETANGLARDLERYLANEPIVARPPSTAYRFQKWMRRHKLAFAAAASVSAALIAGLVTSSYLLFREKEARRRAGQAQRAAQTEARKSQQVAQFLKDMLKAVAPSVAKGRDTTLLKEIVDTTAERVGIELKDQPEVEAELQNALGTVYRSLDVRDKADAAFRRVLQLRRQLRGDEHPEVADALNDLAKTLTFGAKLPEAHELARQALAMRRKLLGENNLKVADSLLVLAEVLGEQDKLSQAEALFRQAVALHEKLGTDNQEKAGALHSLAVTLWGLKRPDEAEKFQKQAHEIYLRLHGEESVKVAHSLNELAAMADSQGRHEEAIELNRKALALRRKLLPPVHSDIGQSLNNLAGCLRRKGDLDEAERLYRESLELHRKVGENQRLVWTLTSFGTLLMQKNDIEEAEGLLREAVPMGRRVLGPEHSWPMLAVNRLAQVLQVRGKFPEAEQLLTEALASGAESSPTRAEWLSLRGLARARFGRWKDAAMDLERAVELNPQDINLRFFLAPLLVHAGDLDGYKKLRQSGLALFGGTTNALVAQRLARHCLILPWSGAGLETAAKWAEAGSEVDPSDRAWPTLVCTKALAEYRQGNFAAAAEWAQKAVGVADRDPHCEAQSFLVLALAQHRMGHAPEAKRTCEKAKEIVTTKLVAHNSVDFGADWANWIIAQVLFREARELIEPGPTTP